MDGIEPYVYRAALIGLCRLEMITSVSQAASGPANVAIFGGYNPSSTALQAPARAFALVYAADAYLTVSPREIRWSQPGLKTPNRPRRQIALSEDDTPYNPSSLPFHPTQANRLPMLIVVSAQDSPDLFVSVQNDDPTNSLEITWHYAVFSKDGWSAFLRLVASGGMELGDAVGFNVPPYS